MSNHTYKMENGFDCGPAALSFVTGIDIHDLKKWWKWKDFNNSKDNLLDSPYHHFDILARTNNPFLIVDDSDILKHKAVDNKTVILLHFEKNIETRNWLSFLDQQVYATLNQHWVVLHSVVNDYVIVHWGDGTLRSIPSTMFRKWYRIGFPNCAFIVGKGSTSIPWYVRIYARITGKFASCL